MKNNSSAIILSSVIVGGSLIAVSLLNVFAIQREGQKTREAMTDTVESVAPVQGKEIVKAASDEILDAAKNRKAEVVETVRKGTRDTIEEMKTILRNEADRPPQEENTSEPPRPSEQSDPKEKVANPVTPNSTNPASILGDLFRTGQEMARSVDELGQDFLQLSEAEEVQLGKEVHKMVRDEYDLLSNRKLTNRLRKLSAPFLENLRRPNMEYHFAVVGSKELNAFSHLGGYVYVNQGLLEKIDSDEELQFVLGHEIAHIDLGHCVQNMTYIARSNQTVGGAGASMVALAYRSISVGYSEDKEFAADARSYLQMGENRPAAILFLTRLMELSGEQNEPEQTQNPVRQGATEIKNHFRTHPATRDRILRLENLESEDAAGGNSN